MSHSTVIETWLHPWIVLSWLGLPSRLRPLNREEHETATLLCGEVLVAPDLIVSWGFGSCLGKHGKAQPRLLMVGYRTFSAHGGQCQSSSQAPLLLSLCMEQGAGSRVHTELRESGGELRCLCRVSRGRLYPVYNKAPLEEEPSTITRAAGAPMDCSPGFLSHSAQS